MPYFCLTDNIFVVYLFCSNVCLNLSYIVSIRSETTRGPEEAFPTQRQEQLLEKRMRTTQRWYSGQPTKIRSEGGQKSSQCDPLPRRRDPRAPHRVRSLPPRQQFMVSACPDCRIQNPTASINSAVMPWKSQRWKARDQQKHVPSEQARQRIHWQQWQGRW